MTKRTPMALACLLLLTSLCVAAVPCFAGTQHGFILRLLVRASDGLVFFYLSGAPTNKPSCATYGYWIIRNENTTTGKQQQAQLLTAYALATPVTVYGANTCTRWSDGEDVDIIALE